MSGSSIYNTDIVIIGAGPVGLFSVFQCGMLKMKCHIVDTLDFIGGQCNALYPEKPIYDIPAYPEISASDLIEKLKEQAAPYNPVYHLGQQVISVESQDNKFKITTSNGTTIECKAVIIAAGCGAFGPNRPPLENLEQYEATKSVEYLVKSRNDYQGKKVVIAGGGDSAIDWAISLSEVVEKLYIVHRRPKFRAAPDSVDKLHKLIDAGKIELVTPYQLASLEGENGKLAAVIVKDLDGNSKALEADILLPFYGLAMELGPIADWGLNIHMKHIEVDSSTCETNIKGIFAVGDIAHYKNKLKLILCGFSEAAMATHAAYDYVYPDKAYHFEYSTSKGNPNA